MVIVLGSSRGRKCFDAFIVRPREAKAKLIGMKSCEHAKWDFFRPLQHCCSAGQVADSGYGSATVGRRACRTAGADGLRIRHLECAA
jgi:hypothetical protein